MRGKGRCKFFEWIHLGITPAYAGKSLQPETVIQIRRDHPRLCGEKPLFAGVFQHVQGSPPPMRGKDNLKIFEFVARRITPAYAGKRNHFSIYHAGNRDHPRLCGEKEENTQLSRGSAGSPPPMRGKALVI